MTSERGVCIRVNYAVCCGRHRRHCPGRLPVLFVKRLNFGTHFFEWALASQALCEAFDWVVILPLGHGLVFLVILPLRHGLVFLSVFPRPFIFACATAQLLSARVSRCRINRIFAIRLFKQQLFVGCKALGQECTVGVTGVVNRLLGQLLPFL